VFSSSDVKALWHFARRCFLSAAPDLTLSDVRYQRIHAHPDFASFMVLATESL